MFSLPASPATTHGSTDVFALAPVFTCTGVVQLAPWSRELVSSERRPACRSAVPPRAMPRATSPRTPPRAASLRSARRAGSRRAGSSCGSSFAENGRQIDRVPLQFLEEDEQPEIGHPLRIENSVEMITLVLDHPGVKALDLAVDGLAVETERAIADAQVARNDTAQPGDREAALPT